MTKKKRILVGFALGLVLVAGGVGYSKWQTAQDFRAYIKSRQWVEARKDAIPRAGLETVESEPCEDANGNVALAMTLRFPR